MRGPIRFCRNHDDGGRGNAPPCRRDVEREAGFVGDDIHHDANRDTIDSAGRRGTSDSATADDAPAEPRGYGGAQRQPRTQKQCITQDEINSAFGNLAPDRGCEKNAATSTAKVQETNLTRTSSTKATGTLHIEAAAPYNVTGSLQMTVGEGEHVMVVKTEFTSRRFGTDCGLVPVVEPGRRGADQ